MQKICIKHGLTEWSEGQRPRCKKCNVEAVIKRRRKIKQMALDYKGNCCCKCGYNKSHRALEFHHIDAKSKSFTISSKGHTYSWNKVKEELDKCILLCANCHAEIHEEKDC